MTEYRDWIRDGPYPEILTRFPGTDPCVFPAAQRERPAPLLRWSMVRDFVDLIARGSIVPATDFLDFLYRYEFDPI
jgi:hypothetical protein